MFKQRDVRSTTKLARQINYIFEILKRIEDQITTIIGGSGGVSTITGEWVDNSDPENPTINRPYSTYVALLTQTGTSAPTAIVLENTLGVTPTFTYNGAGQYKINVALANLNKVFYTMPNKAQFDLCEAKVQSIDSAGFNLRSIDDTGANLNGLMENTPIEIRIYP